MIICYTLLVFTYCALGGACDEWLLLPSTMSLYILYNIYNTYSGIVTDHLHYWEYILIPTHPLDQLLDKYSSFLSGD